MIGLTYRSLNSFCQDFTSGLDCALYTVQEIPDLQAKAENEPIDTDQEGPLRETELPVLIGGQDRMYLKATCRQRL